MKTLDAISHYGSAARLADAMGISRAAVSQWGDTVPASAAALLEKMTGGVLVFDPNVYIRKRGRLWAPHPAPAAEDRAA